MRNHATRLFMLLLSLLVAVALAPVSAQEEATPEPQPLAGAEGLTFQRSVVTSERTTLTVPTLSPGDTNSPRFAVHPSVPSSRAGQGSALTTAQQAVRGTITALVVLDGAPALASLPAGGDLRSGASSVQAAAATLSAAQSTLSSSLARVGSIQVKGALRYTANALVVTMDASQIASVEALPGVQAVIPDQIGYLDNAHSVPFINAVRLWEENGGNTGAGVRIGIIDSGIDYTHANFGGSGDTSHYTGNNSADISDFGFDGSKVVGGYDFVGDAWAGGALTGAGGSPLGSAWAYGFGDNDPLDCNGHGSHVAGTAAGFGVNEDGSTFAGPWDSTAPFNDMRIGPGVAPEAELYALKIGGCGNLVSYVAAAFAIEFALDPDGNGNPSDHLDVINNSYGGAYGTPLEFMVSQFDLAAQAGIVVVGSAGNETDTYFVNGDPSISEWAISTASSVNDTVYNGLQIDSGPGGAYPTYPTVIPAKSSQGGALGTFGSFPLKLVGGSGNSQGCALSDYDGFAGEAGLIVWTAAASGCGSGTRMTNAVNHGSVSGLVVVSANPADFPFINLACTYNGGDSPIPCVSITATDGSILQTDPPAFGITFDSGLTAPLGVSIADQLSGFSSRGPRIDGGTGEVILKPDLAAPGDAIVSTSVGTGNEAETLGGTSMASPHVTGSAALLRQLHPTWSVPEIKALLMNTATHDLFTEPNMSGDKYGVSRVGAGRIDLANALNSEVVAYHTDHPERVSVSYGLVEVIDTVNINQTITVENKGAAPQTYDVSFQQANDTPGVQLLVSPSQITVPAGSTTTVTVTLTANKAQMANANVPDPTTPTTQTGAFGPLPRHRIMEEGGYVVLASTDPVSDLRVPVHASARPSADMMADGDLIIGGGDMGFSFLPLTGNDVFTGGSFPNDVISTVTAFEVVATDPQGPFTELGGADVQYVGITSDYLTRLTQCAGDVQCAIDNTTVFVGLSVYGQWSTMSGFEAWFDIGFDSNEDNAYDATAFNFETGYLVGADFTDTILSWATDGGSWLTDGGNPISADYINGLGANALETYVFNNSVIVFPVWAGLLGLSPDNTDFQFDVRTFSSFFDTDWIPPAPPFWYTYDLADPTYYFNDGNGFVGGPYAGVPMWNDLDGFAIPVDYDVTGLTDLPPILLLHHHNAKDATVGRAELVTVTRSGDMDGAVTKTVDNDTPSEGQNVTFTVIVSDEGPGPLEDPVITDTLPAGLTYVSDTCPGASSTTAISGGTQVVCDLTGFSIPASLGASYEIVASVDAGTTGSILTNLAELTDFRDGATDANPDNNKGGAPVCVGAAAGSCDLRVDQVYDNVGVSMKDNPVVGTQIGVVHIRFNMPVMEGTGPDGAANPANYRLLSPGSAAGFQTNTCTTPVDAGDTPIGFSVTYAPSTATATLDLAGNESLPEGQYRLIICGSTSIVDLRGIPLDGNADNTTGDDALIDFEVNFATGVTVPTVGLAGGSAAAAAANAAADTLTAEQLAAMQLPATGETPAWQPLVPLGFGAVVLVLVVGAVIYRRRTQN